MTLDVVRGAADPAGARAGGGRIRPSVLCDWGTLDSVLAGHRLHRRCGNIHVDECVYVCTCMDMCMQVWACIHVCLYKYVWIVCMCGFVFMYASVYMCVCVTTLETSKCLSQIPGDHIDLSKARLLSSEEGGAAPSPSHK